MNDEWISVPEAVSRFAISRSSLQRLYARRLIRFEKHVGDRYNLVEAGAVERAIPQIAPVGYPRGRPRGPLSPAAVEARAARRRDRAAAKNGE